MKIIGVKKISPKIFKNKKGDLLKFVSKKNSFFKSFGEIYFNEIRNKKIKGWIKHKKNQCIFSVAYGSINFKLIDDRKTSRSYRQELNIVLKKDNSNILVVPPGVWFSFTTNKTKSVLVNLINNVHSDSEVVKTNVVNKYYIK
tara:strand:- start:120 stop:548 length:429 start_codon:yes stop_codon:yes gene_type:complete